MSRMIRCRMLTRLAAPVVLASALGACSSIPDWVDPTGWFGSDSQANTDASGSTNPDSSQSDSGKTPDLADIPAKPTPPSTTDDQQQVANGLIADRAQAKYSAESLQGGTEPVAAPPPPESSDTTSVPASPPSGAAAVPAASEAASDTVSTAESSAAPAPAAEAAPQPASADSTSNTQVATTETPASAVPAPAPMATVTSAPATEMQTSFAPSRAPALDPSVEQYVPQRILSRYQATAAAAAVPGVQGMSTVANKPAHRRNAKAMQPEQATDSAAPAQ